MKYLFFLLLLGNIVLYLWETGVGREAQDVREKTEIPEAGERIVLIKELKKTPAKVPESPPTAQAQEVEAPGLESGQASVSQIPASAEALGIEQLQSPPPPAVDSVCYRLGPYVSPRKAIAASAALGGLRAEVVKQSTEVEGGYTMMYPPAENLQAARENLKAMVEKGLKDAWVVEKGEYRYAVSLAVFRNKDHADAALVHFHSMGIPAELKPRMIPGHTWWLRIHGTSGERPSLEGAVAKPEIGAGTAKVEVCE